MYRVTARYEFEEYRLHEMFSDEYVLISPVLTEKVGKAGSFKFDIPINHPSYRSVLPFQTYVTIYKDDIEYWHGRVIDAEEDFYRTKSVTCEGELGFLNDSIIPVYQFSGNIPEYIDSILLMHNSQVEEEKKIYRGNVEVTDPNGYLTRANQNYPDTLSELTNKLIDTYGGYFRTRRVNGKIYIDYLYEYGELNQQQLRIEENIIDYSCKFGGDFCTRLIPLGAKQEDAGEEDPQRITISSANGGVIYVDNAELVARYGIIVGTKTWDDVTDPVHLKLKGQSYINSQEFPQKLELTAVDLSNINIDIDALRIGCMATVISPFHELGAAYFLSSKTSHLDAPEEDSVSLGAEIDTFTGKTAKRQQDTENQISKVEQEARESIVNIGKTITGTKGGYVVLDTFDDSGKLVDPWQLLIMDRPDKTQAVNVIRMNQGGIAFSTSGYNGPYKSAWDINGQFVADFIRAGTMLADRIRGGTLQLGGQSNQNGVLKILNASGQQIGIWDKDGIRMSSGPSQVNFTSLQSGSAIELIGNVIYGTGRPDKSRATIDSLRIKMYSDRDDVNSAYIEEDADGITFWINRNESSFYGAENMHTVDATIDGNLDVSGEKNRIVKTGYGDIKMAAYETASPMFGDVGSGTIGADGLCYVTLDSIFSETVNAGCEYQVFLQAYGPGNIYVSDRTPAFFIAAGQPGQRFGWEIKAKQRGYEQHRLDCRRDRLKAQNSVDYAAEGAEYYKKYMEGLII